MTNFKVEAERIEDMYDAAEFNGEFHDTVAILRHIHEKLVEEQNEKPTPGKSTTTNNTRGAQGAQSINTSSGQ